VMNPGKRFGVGDGRIDPEGLPGKLLDGEAVRGVAAGLGSRASVIRESADTMLLKWSVLPQALSGEGLEPLWCGLSAPLNRVISVADRFDSAKTALLRFADKADEHHKAYTVLYADAVAFRAKIDPGVWMPIADTSYWDSCWLDPAAREVEFWQGRGFEARDGNWRTSVEILVEWTQSRALVEENDRLFHRANQLASDISWSEADCVNALNGLSVHGCPVPQRGVDATDLDGWAGQGHNRLPWGGTPDWDHNFGGSVQLGFEDFWDGLKNAAGLIGFDPASGRWSWGTAGRSWSGLVNTFGSAAFVVLFSPMIVPIGFAGLVNPGGTGRVLNDWRHDSVLGAWFLDHLDMAVQNLIGAGQGLVDYEHWGDDPVRAGTATLLNVGTLFVGGGEVLGVTKAGLETVETVVKTGRLAEMAGAGLRVIDKAQDWANQVIHPWRDGTKPLDGVNPQDLTRVHEPEPAPREHVGEEPGGPSPSDPGYLDSSSPPHGESPHSQDESTAAHPGPTGRLDGPNPHHYSEASPDNVGQPYYDGVGKTTVGPEDIDEARRRWGVPEKETMAVGRTDVPGFEGVTFEGGSATVRRASREAGNDVLDWDDDPILRNTEIDSPEGLPANRQHHAESNVLAYMDDAFTRAGIDPNVAGTVTIEVSLDTGVCPTCKSGLLNPNAADGPIKIFSEKYPNLELVFQSPGLPDYVVRGGVRIS